LSSTCCRLPTSVGPAPIRNGSATAAQAALLTVVLLFTPAAQAIDKYERAIQTKKLVEGLGFEGVLTVFDETPRMYNMLGDPRRDLKHPGWYFYDSDASPVSIAVFAEYREQRFFIKSIQYGGEPGRGVVTNTGIRLGDPISKVTQANGDAESVRGNQYIYASRGVTYFVGRKSTIIAIQVFRPGPKAPTTSDVPPALRNRPGPETPGLPGVTPAVAKVRPLGLLDAGLSLPMPSEWTPVGTLTREHMRFRGADGAVTLDVKACVGCAAKLGDKVREFEGARSENQIPVPLRDVDRRWLTRMNAETGYVGLYLSEARREWLIAIRKDKRAWMVTVVLDTARPLSQATVRDVAAAIAGVRIMGGAGK